MGPETVRGTWCAARYIYIYIYIYIFIYFKYVYKLRHNLKCTGIFISVYDKLTKIPKAEDIAVMSRDYTYTGNPITQHLALTTSNSGTKSLKNLTTPFLGGTQNYLVCQIQWSSSDSVFLGGYLEIKRV